MELYPYITDSIHYVKPTWAWKKVSPIIELFTNNYLMCGGYYYVYVTSLSVRKRDKYLDSLTLLLALRGVWLLRLCGHGDRFVVGVETLG